MTTEDYLMSASTLSVAHLTTLSLDLTLNHTIQTFNNPEEIPTENIAGKWVQAFSPFLTMFSII